MPALHVFFSAREIASDGVNAIVDMIFMTLSQIDGIYAMFCDILRDTDVIKVRLECSPEDCRKRNIGRGYMEVGLSEWQRPMMRTDIDHDLVLDTSELDPTQCAERILELLGESAGC